MKRFNRRASIAPFTSVVTALAALSFSQGCKLIVVHDDADGGYAGTGGAGASQGAGGWWCPPWPPGSAGYQGAGGGHAGTGGKGGSGGSGGTGGSGGKAGSGGSGGSGINPQCLAFDWPDDGDDEPTIACGAPCLIEGVNTQFVCSEEGQCVPGPIVCGSGLCEGKACGESCGAPGGATTCDLQGRCVSGPASCGRPADLCAGRLCGDLVFLEGSGVSFCFCDASGDCVSGGPIDCGTEACLGMECGFECRSDLAPRGICTGGGHCLANGSFYGLCELSPRCEGGACGADCSVDDVDVALSCNPQGRCVDEPVACTP